MWDDKKINKAKELIDKGLAAKDIAKKLGIKPGTFYSWAWRNDIDYNRNKNYLKSINPKIKDLVLLGVDGYNKSQIAVKLGISRQAVNRICKKYNINIKEDKEPKDDT